MSVVKAVFCFVLLANPGPLMKALTGLEFAPIISIASGFRANPIMGLDSNREHIFRLRHGLLGIAETHFKLPPISISIFVC